MKLTSSKVIFLSGIALFIIASIWLTLNDQFASLKPYLHKLEASWLSIILLHAVIYRFVNACGWVFIMRTLRTSIPIRKGVQIWLVSETCRWLPGSIWSTFSRVHLSQKAKLPITSVSIGVSIEFMITILAWSMVACTGILYSGSYHVITPYLKDLKSIAIVVCAGIFTCLAGLLFINTLIRHSEKISSQLLTLKKHLIDVKERGVSSLGLLGVLAFFALCCFYNGYIFWLILESLDLSVSLSKAVMANSLGWIVGFLAIAAPGGIGVREATLTLVLLDTSSAQAIGLCAVLWRLTQITSELVCLIPWLCQKLFSLIQNKLNHAN